MGLQRASARRFRFRTHRSHGTAERQRCRHWYREDKTGAVIANATVTANNTATGISTVTKTTGAGDYNFSNLDPGIYSVTTVATGFEKLTQQNIHVNALESQTYNPALQVGTADVQITVTAAPPQLETSNATLGATMEQETYSRTAP